MKTTMKALTAAALLFAMTTPAHAGAFDGLVSKIISVAGELSLDVNAAKDNTFSLIGLDEEPQVKSREDSAARQEGAKRVINRLFD